MHRNHHQKTLVAAVSVALASTLAAPAVLAQGRQLEEVLVTAQKRVQSSQDIPVAVTAIGSEMIENLGINQTQDLVKLTPSLTVGVGDNKQNSSFRLRGIGTDVYSVGVEQSVAVLIDDVSSVQAGQAIGNLVDIERIEVLRGPQSTLFGKSASAGVLSIVTKSPSEELEGSVEVTLTDDDEERILGSVSGPITDALGYRITGHWSDRDGFVNNLTINDDVNSEKSKGLRGKLQWDINDNVQSVLTAYYSEDESTCCALTWLDLDPSASVFGFVPGEVAPGITPSDQNLDFRSEDGPEDKTETTGGNLRFNVGLGEFVFTSITAIDKWEYGNDGDVDFSDVDVYGLFTGGAVTGGNYSVSTTETDFFSQEFRLASPSYDRYEYLVGAYYADAETDRSFERNLGLPIIPSDWDGTAGTETMALFGQATLRFGESTSLTGGLRWNDEEISAHWVENISSPDAPISASDSDSEIVGNLSLQHFLGEDTMLYARLATGYKGQAYDMTSSFNQGKADNPVAPETSESFELGVKSMLLDNRLQLNLTAFWTEYEDYQAQSTQIAEDGSLDANLYNVGVLETKGLELEGVALIGENLTLTFGASYIDATIDEWVGASCYDGQIEETGCIDGTQDISGGDLPNSPEWKWNIVADYQADLGSMPFYGFVNASYVWQDEVNFSLLQNPLTAQDSYGVGDLSIGINEKDKGRYRVTAFVNNFTDENYRSGIADLRQLYGGATSLANIFARNSQRYYGVRLKYSF
ncbi:TonB-dependent receptor [Halieaceae bacterium IMCC14734]|uniref:TonB-dependent receptor n=1 Tax=Candidatus Litorirhabdus singularis TaxID=2518993 RepID=A0ABT3TKU8_9GAMM|nr:TonB-dependent receptor [Candidatus Litorirhabdus singularis]MCX2982034.1 TonB-dependent receptor [Candidatus Litorirhabdus singularis]